MGYWHSLDSRERRVSNPLRHCRTTERENETPLPPTIAKAQMTLGHYLYGWHHKLNLFGMTSTPKGMSLGGYMVLQTLPYDIQLHKLHKRSSTESRHTALRIKLRRNISMGYTHGSPCKSSPETVPHSACYFGCGACH